MLANKIKKFLCRTGSIYKDGKLKVPAASIVIFGFLFFVVVGLGAWVIYSLLTNTTKTLEAIILLAAMLIGGFGALYLIGKAIQILTPQFIKTYLKLLGSKLELTCDTVMFPEEVKSIYAQIESLDKENLNYFFKGIYRFPGS